MANTYSQVNIHCVFAVKGRENIITVEFRDELFKQMAGILRNDNAYPLAVNGWKDHVHVFCELPMTATIAQLMSSLKASSSKWINDHKLIQGHFEWQTGYGAFSYSKSQRDNVIQYIMNQEEHHKSTSFRDEYLKLFIYSILNTMRNIFLNSIEQEIYKAFIHAPYAWWWCCIPDR